MALKNRRRIMACQLRTFTILPTPLTATFSRVTQSYLFGVHPASNLTFIATLDAFKRLIIFRGVMRSRERTASMSATRECRPSTAAKTLTLCQPVIIAHSKINFCKRKCVNIRTNYGLWSPKLLVKVKEFKWFLRLMRYPEALASRLVLCSSIFTIHFW